MSEKLNQFRKLRNKIFALDSLREEYMNLARVYQLCNKKKKLDRVLELRKKATSQKMKLFDKMEGLIDV
jgi:hypothetical protein